MTHMNTEENLNCADAGTFTSKVKLLQEKEEKLIESKAKLVTLEEELKVVQDKECNALK